MSVIPEKMKALVIQSKGSAIILEKPVPDIDPDEVLVRSIAVAQNPTDCYCTRSCNHALSVSYLLNMQISTMWATPARSSASTSPVSSSKSAALSRRSPSSWVTASRASPKAGITPIAVRTPSTQRLLPSLCGRSPRTRCHTNKLLRWDVRQYLQAFSTQ